MWQNITNVSLTHKDHLDTYGYYKVA